MSLLTLGMTSCKDYIEFDQDAYDNYVKESFVVDNVDPNHQWATVGVATAFVSVATGTGDSYKVKIYDQNPIGSKGTLTLLGEGSVKDNGTMDMQINYSLAKPYAYVTLFDTENYMSVYPALIKDGRLEVVISGKNAAAASRRGIQPTFHFADMPNDVDFATSVPNGALPEDQCNGGGTGVNVVVSHEYVSYLNLWNGGSTVYFPAGNWTIQGQYIAGDFTIYLLPGANVTFESELNLNSPNGRMYVAEGATVNARNGIGYNFWLYNRGTINTAKMTQYAAGALINEGTVNIEQNLQIANSSSQVVNAGIMTAGSMSVEGSGHFENLGKMTVTGATVVNSTDCTWVNSASYTTGSFTYTAGSYDVINNCRLVVNETFYIGLADNAGDKSFQMNGGASVMTKDFIFSGPGYIYMGSNSLFQVTDRAMFAINKDGYGIYGPSTGEAAVFQANSVERLNSWESNQAFAANYYGHLFVATNSHFALGYSDKTDQQVADGEVGMYPYFRLDAPTGAAMTTYEGAKVTLCSECADDYIGKPDDEDRPEVPQSYRYCFEDNFPDVGDYDFNDVVLTMTPTLNDKTLTIQVSLDAVGAIKTLGAAFRLVGVKSSDLASYSVQQGFASPDNQGLGIYQNINTNETILRENQAPNATQDMVVVLFKDAHWAINPVKGSNGGVQNLFYNTIKKGTGEHRNAYVEPATATYTFVFNDAEKAKAMLAENLYDVFIVEPYNGGYWEVHTVQNGFKTTQVFMPIKPAGYAEAYGSNMPWAILVPGNFKYPLEWQIIGSSSNKIAAYQTEGHSFAEWAMDSSKATDWYLYPTEGLVYE
jgi:LruC domain-containing protein